MKGFDETHVKSYFEYMVEVAELLGSEKAVAEEELRKALEFEIELAMVCQKISINELNYLLF